MNIHPLLSWHLPQWAAQLGGLSGLHPPHLATQPLPAVILVGRYALSLSYFHPVIPL